MTLGDKTRFSAPQSHGDAGYAQLVRGHTATIQSCQELNLVWLQNPSFLLPHIERDVGDEGSSNPNCDCQRPVNSILSLQSRHDFSHPPSVTISGEETQAGSLHPIPEAGLAHEYLGWH